MTSEDEEENKPLPSESLQRLQVVCFLFEIENFNNNKIEENVSFFN